jgi:hypothetical protein
MRTSLFAGILLAPLAVVAALGAPAAADRAEDDLQLVKKAVGSSSVAQTRPPAEEPPPPRAEAAPPTRKGAPSWFRVRIVDKANKPTKVSVNLPLGLVRAFGDDWPIGEHGRCRQDHRCATLGEVLRALDSGQSLVEIEDDEATVRVWVE